MEFFSNGFLLPPTVQFNRCVICICMFWIVNLEFESSLLSLLDDITKGTTVIINHSGKCIAHLNIDQVSFGCFSQDFVNDFS